MRLRRPQLGKSRSSGPEAVPVVIVFSEICGGMHVSYNDRAIALSNHDTEAKDV